MKLQLDHFWPGEKDNESGQDIVLTLNNYGLACALKIGQSLASAPSGWTRLLQGFDRLGEQV